MFVKRRINHDFIKTMITYAIMEFVNLKNHTHRVPLALSFELLVFFFSSKLCSFLVKKFGLFLCKKIQPGSDQQLRRQGTVCIRSMQFFVKTERFVEYRFFERVKIKRTFGSFCAW